MLDAINTFFKKHLAPPKAAGQQLDTHRGRLAAAALLVEVVHADHDINDSERDALLAGIRGRFELSDAEAGELMALAKEEARASTDLHQFTSQINQAFDLQQKIWLVEELWRMAYADQTLHRHEEYLVRKVTDLIHVPNTALMAAKHRAQSSK
jgi:uncharacterized tellurite resistance protein B-like protein